MAVYNLLYESFFNLLHQMNKVDRFGVKIITARALRAFSGAPDIAWAVKAMIGILLVTLSALSCFVASHPFKTGKLVESAKELFGKPTHSNPDF